MDVNLALVLMVMVTELVQLMRLDDSSTPTD